MRGLDDWISRGHERMDDDPEPLHPDDESMLNTAEAGIERELDMAQSMAAAMDAMVKKIRGD